MLRAMRTTIGALCAAALLAPAGAQTLLKVDEDVLDGPVEDLAGYPDSTNKPGQRRVWIAQGRTRWALDPRDRGRYFAEDAIFAAVTGEPEQLLALELDVANKRLYTLTASALYSEDVSEPSEPLITSHLVLGYPAGHLPAYPEEWDPAEEPVLDIKLVPSADRIVILTEARLLVVHDQGGQMVYQSAALDLVTAPRGWLGTNQDLVFNSTRVNVFVRPLRLDVAENNKRIALVQGQMSGYTQGGRPAPQMILMVDLDEAGGFAAPSFDFDPLPGGKVRFLYYNPMPLPPSASPSAVNADYTAYAHDSFTDDQGLHHALLACGKENQVHLLHIDESLPTSYPASGMEFIGQHDVTGLAGVPGDGVEVLSVLADREKPHRFFALTEPGFHVFDPTGPAPVNQMTENESFGTKGARRDLLQIDLPAATLFSKAGQTVTPSSVGTVPQFERRTVWTAVKGKVDHVCKVVRVGTDHNPLHLEDEYFGISSSDGAVAIEDEIYIPTFGGVVRYTNVGGASSPSWLAVPESYQPAEAPAGSGDNTNTEHIDVGKVDGIHRLFTTSALGNFMEFEIDEELNPRPALRFDPDTSLLPTVGSWTNYPNGSFYSNDVAFLDLDPNSTTQGKFVLTPLTNYWVFGNPIQVQHLLLAYRYEQVGQSHQWVHVATVESALVNAVNAADVELSKAIVIADVPAHGKTFVFVTHDQGFFVADVTGLTGANPSMTLTDEVDTPVLINGVPVNFGVWSIARARDRIFLQVLSPQKVYRIYPWNEANGTVSPYVTEYTDTDLFGSLKPGRAFRARFQETDPGTGAGYLYLAGEPRLVQLAWPGSGPVPENSLDFTGYWKSDYVGELQDCRVFDLPVFGEPRILLSKNAEAFAIIDPDPGP